MATTVEEFEFTEREMEGLEFTAGEEAEIEEEMLEDSLEDVEDIESGEAMEGQEFLPIAIIGKIVGKQLLKALFKIAKKLIVKALTNATMRNKLGAAAKAGQRQFCGLLCPLICRRLPPWLRPLCRRLCPIVCRKFHPWVLRKVGA